MNTKPSDLLEFLESKPGLGQVGDVSQDKKRGGGQQSSDDLAGRLRKAREAAGMTQDQLAEKAGVSRMSVQFLEQRRHKGINTRTLEKLAAALGVDASVLLQGEPPMHPALKSFLDSQPPGAITDEERRKLMDVRVVMGPDATEQTFAILLTLIRTSSGT